MRPLDQLINDQDSALPFVIETAKSQPGRCTIHPASPAAGNVLYRIQVTTRSPMGAIAYHTGGISVLGGWLRILGAGSPAIPRSLPDWNESRSSGFYLVADDAFGRHALENHGDPYIALSPNLPAPLATDCDPLMIKLPLLLLLGHCLLCGTLSAQAPADWSRLADGEIVEKDGHRITFMGPWRSPDGSINVLLSYSGELKDIQALNDRWAGLQSGVMQKELLPLKFESTVKPHLSLILRGQMEHAGKETFQDLHFVLTKKGAWTLHVYGSKPDLSIDLAKWELGEPFQDEGGKFAERVKELAKVGNDSLAKFQDLVKKLRKASP